MTHALLMQQKKQYETELAEVNAALQEIIKSGQENSLGTQSGMSSQIKRVQYDSLTKRQQHLMHSISDIESTLSQRSNRTSRVI